MRPAGLQYTDLEANGELVTAIDVAETPANFALETIGFRLGRERMIGERDYGTKHYYAAYPTLPSNMKLVGAYNIYDKNTATTYDIVVALDTSDKMHVYVNDTTLGPNNPGIAGNWIELTRTFSALVDDASIGATDKTVGVDTTADSLGGAVTWATNEVRYWIVVNTTRSKVCFVASSTVDSITGDAVLGSGGLGFQNNDELTFYQNNGIYQGFNSTNGTLPHIRWNDNEALVRAFLYYGSASAVDASPTMRSPIAIERKSAERKYFYYDATNALVSLGGTSPTPGNWYSEIGGGGLIPSFEEVGTIASPKGVLIGANITGTVSVTPGTTVVGSISATFQTELEVGQYILIVTDAGDGPRRIATIVSESVLTVETAYTGTATDVTCVAYTAQTAEIEDTSGIDWLKLSAFISASTPSGLENYRGLLMYATVLYDDGTKESDPVWRLVASADQRYIPISIVARVNFARMNKRISGLRFYSRVVGYSTVGGFADAVALTSDEDSKLVYELPFNSLPTGTVWSKLYRSYTGETEGTEPSGYIYKAILPDLTYTYVNDKLTSSPSNILDNLAHPLDFNRSYLTPRFAVRSIRAGGNAIVAVDQGDQFLRLSSYNGDGVHEDDNFPDVTVDNNGARLKIALTTRGETMGLSVLNDRFTVYRRTEVEYVDMQSGVSESSTCDFLGRRSLISTPIGDFFGGRAAIYLNPVDGGSIRVVNPLWQNLYDGTLRLADDTAARVSNANRLALVIGYDAYYEDIWAFLPTTDPGGTAYQLNYRLFLRANTWRTREVNCGSAKTVQFFVMRRDNTFAIGYGHSATANGLLKYPNLDTGTAYTNSTVTNYEDDVSSADASASKGITTKLLLNFGNLYSLVSNAVLYDILVDSLGTMRTGSGTYNLKFYANRETTAFDSKTQDYTAKSSPRAIAPRGPLESLQLELSLIGNSNLQNYKKWEISRLSLGHVTQPRIGNR